MAITFLVSPVRRATEPLRMPDQGTPPRLQTRAVEAMGASPALFLPSEEHGLLRAVHTAYALHHPLVLTPDAIWLAVAQGFAMHVNANAERLRGRFVRHDGQATIKVRRDDFVKGSPANPWPEAFGAFSDAVAAHIGRQRDLVVCDFSTTGPCERAASEIVLLDAVQRYFRYELHTLCGIPEITLEGTVEDWRNVRRRARALEEYELGWWTDALGPVLDQLVATAEGRVDARFWETLFKHADGSGGPWVQGWINVLFPYLRPGGGEALVRNDRMATWREGLSADHGGGPSPASIPSGLSSVPFEWHYALQMFPMRFLGGFVGVAQDPATLALRPAIGWAVRDDVVVQPPTPAELRVQAFASLRSRALERRVTLIAGLESGPLSLTAGEVATLVARVDQVAADVASLADPLTASLGRGPVALAAAATGDFADAGAFPEAPSPCRLVVGVRVGSVDAQSTQRFAPGGLHGAHYDAEFVPEAVWRAVADLIPGGLGGAPQLFLVASGARLRGELRYGPSNRDEAVLVAEATASDPRAVAVSLREEDALRKAARARGVPADDLGYTLVATWAR